MTLLNVVLYSNLNLIVDAESCKYAGLLREGRASIRFGARNSFAIATLICLSVTLRIKIQLFTLVTMKEESRLVVIHNSFKRAQVIQHLHIIIFINVWCLWVVFACAVAELILLRRRYQSFRLLKIEKGRCCPRVKRACANCSLNSRSEIGDP